MKCLVPHWYTRKMPEGADSPERGSSRPKAPPVGVGQHWHWSYGERQDAGGEAPPEVRCPTGESYVAQCVTELTHMSESLIGETNKLSTSMTRVETRMDSAEKRLDMLMRTTHNFGPRIWSLERAQSSEGGQQTSDNGEKSSSSMFAFNCCTLRVK